MGKAKLAICMEDADYQERFVKCLMNHYKEKYEIHSFSNMLDLKTGENPEFELFILEGCTFEADAKKLAKEEKNILYLREEWKKCENDANLIYLEMFQEVYKIMEAAESLIGGKGIETGNTAKRIGVYSLECPALQLPYCGMLASIYGETKSVLLLNLLPNAGMLETEEEVSGLEDVIASVSTGNTTRGRVLSGIGHMQKWDYIYPVKNTEHLAEIEGKSYEEVLEWLGREQGYEIIIINFGASFSGIFDLMDTCQEFHLLERKGTVETWREDDFKKELKRREKNEFLNRIAKVQLPFVSSTDETWKGLSEKWEWGPLGDHVRKQVRMEKTGG